MTEEPLPTHLSIDDLKMAIVAIELACQRGAYRATEMAPIGLSYDKIQQFITTAELATKTQGETNV